MNTIKVCTDYLQRFISKDELAGIASETLAAKKTLLSGSGPGNDFLGWVDLPQNLDSSIISNIKSDVKRLAPNTQLFVVIGIGGSYLGARAVIEALQSEFASMQPNGKHPYIVYAGHTLSEDYYHQLIQVLDCHDYAVAVISKSGTTTEPAVAFRIVKAHLEKKYGKAHAAERIIAVTDASRGALHDIAQQEGYRTYIIPDNAGARDMREMCVQSDDVQNNPALLYAAVRNILYRKGPKVEILENFVPQLRYISEWWKQLYGESEGKDGKGILPHSLSFTTDLHSMGQYVQDGERSMFETVISVAKPTHTVDIPADAQNLDGINYLLGKSLTEINHNAELGTIMAHVDGGVPVLRIEIPTIDEYTLGQLLYFFEFACGVSGYMLKVNPFNQPGVEAYKKNMFHLLGKPGYEQI